MPRMSVRTEEGLGLGLGLGFTFTGGTALRLTFLPVVTGDSRRSCA
jgi:hypothetical protein